MVIQMNDSKLATIEQIREFLAGTADVSFTTPAEPAQVRTFIAKVLRRFKYADCSKAQRSILFAYMQRLSGYSKAHLARLISQYKDTKNVTLRSRANRTSFARRFTEVDIGLLAQLDSLHDTLSGPATRVLLHRAFHLFGDTRYERLANISVSHLYNLRASDRYRHLRTSYELTKPTRTNIGIRKAPAPEGLPGYIRIDTVHQGDFDGVKGVYHINAVDIVTQWQIVVCVERISEAYLLPVIKLMLESFPFVIHGFHSDNGSEFINHEIAKLLNKLRIEFTKSRPRHSNDNALVECKNGVVIRKLMGYSHIPQERAKFINLFFKNTMNPYLNFHRPCFFAVDKSNAKGKVIKTYPHDHIMTPWDRLQTIANFQSMLKPDITLEALQKQAIEQTDSQAAEQLQKARKLLFQSLNKSAKLVA
jgi:hypothetical protein